MRYAVLAGLMLTSATAAVAQEDWVVYARSGAVDALYSPSRVRYEGQTAFVWIRYNTGLSTVPGSHHVLVRVAVDCTNATTEVLAMSAYNEAGRVVRSESYTERRVNRIPPDSVDEALMETVCVDPDQTVAADPREAAPTSAVALP